MKQRHLERRAGRTFVIGGSSDSIEQRIAAAALGAAGHLRTSTGPVGAASHRSAARLLGFRTVDTDVDVSIRHPRKLTIPGAKVVRSRDLTVADITWVDGIPVTTPERTICDLGLVFPETEVMRILRHAVAVGQVDRRDVLRMRLRISEHGRNGAGVIGRCLEALPELAEQTESGLEVMFLEMCESFDLPEPVLQLPVVANGRAYRLDFAFPQERVFVEIDGRWHAEPMQISKDGGRQNDLVSNGWHPVRFDYETLRHSEDHCADVLHRMLTTHPALPI